MGGIASSHCLLLSVGGGVICLCLFVCLFDILLDQIFREIH
jgi:hypothetical protein